MNVHLNVADLGQKIARLKSKGYTARESDGFFFVFRADGTKVARSKSNIDNVDAWHRAITGRPEFA